MEIKTFKNGQLIKTETVPDPELPEIDKIIAEIQSRVAALEASLK